MALLFFFCPIAAADMSATNRDCAGHSAQQNSAVHFAQEKSPVETGPSLMGGNTPMGARSCYLSRRGCAKAESAIPEGLWRPVVAMPQWLTAAGRGTNPPGNTLVGRRWTALHPPVSPPSSRFSPRLPPEPGLFLCQRRAIRDASLWQQSEQGREVV